MEALDAAEAALQFDFCDYVYVDTYNRVVAIFDYNDVHPDDPVQKNQERVLIPHYKHADPVKELPKEGILPMTTVFACERCDCADNIHSTQTTSAGYLCHECLHGTWHNEFPKERWDYYTHGPALNKQPPSGGDGFPSFS